MIVLRKIALLTGILTPLVFGMALTVSADCAVTGSTPDSGEVVECTDTDNDGYEGTNNDDQLTVQPGANVSDDVSNGVIDMDDGDDLITVNGGSVTNTDEDAIDGNDGNDTFIMHDGNISGDEDGLEGNNGNDVFIIHGGTIYGDDDAIDADSDDDLVIIYGGTINGEIEGGSGTDTLGFGGEVRSQHAYNVYAQRIAAANPSGGTLTFRGQTYTWEDFEQLLNLLELVLDVQTPGVVPDPTCFIDGRLNNCDFAAPAAVYCQGNGVRVFDILDGGTGVPAFDVSGEAIDAALQQAVQNSSNVLVGQGLGNSLYALQSNELQLMGAPINGGDPYSFVFDGNACG